VNVQRVQRVSLVKGAVTQTIRAFGGVLLVLLGLVGLVMVSSPAFAHHGGAAYDAGNKITLKGTVSNFEWTNPHTQVHFDVTDDKGNVQHWNFENQPPSILIHAGWTKNSLKPGDEVTIIATPAKNGSYVGLLSKVIFPDGRELTPTEK